MNSIDEFDLELLEDYLDDALSPSQVERIGQRLAEEPELARAMGMISSAHKGPCALVHSGRWNRRTAKDNGLSIIFAERYGASIGSILVGRSSMLRDSRLQSPFSLLVGSFLFIWPKLARKHL